MWKCKECWNNQLTLGIWCGPLSQHPLPPARHQPHLLIPSAQTINQKKAKNPEMRSNSQQIVSYCLGLRTQNPGLREVDLEPSLKRGSDKINMQKQRRNTQKKASHIVQPRLTYGSQHLERYTWNPVLREEPIGPKYCWAFSGHLKAPILNSLQAKSDTNQPR